MPERKQLVQQFQLDYLCDELGCTGTLKHTGLVLTSYPAQYPHECTHCGCKRTFRGYSYPRFVTEVVGKP